VKLFRSSDFLPEYDSFSGTFEETSFGRRGAMKLQYLVARQVAVEHRCATACFAMVLTGLAIDADDCREVGRPSDRACVLHSLIVDLDD
jgi:hypothetical protein